MAVADGAIGVAFRSNARSISVQYSSHAASTSCEIFAFSARPQLALRHFLAEFPDGGSDVVAIESEDFAVFPDASYEHVNVSVIGVVVIDRDPFEPRPKIALHGRDQVARMLLQIDLSSHLLAIR